MASSGGLSRAEPLEVTLLGSGGGIPTPARATCSALLRRGSDALLIDAGTGISHLVADPQLIGGIETVDVLLTHFHLDHVVGLAFLPSLALSKAVRILGPGRALYRADTRSILTRLLTHPFLATGWDLPAISTEIRELGEGDLALGPFAIATRVQRFHSDPTLAIRVDDELAYCTDTAYDAGNVEFARGCRTLVHEAWYTGDSPQGVDSHSSAADAARVAQDAGVDALVLIHINPRGDDHLLAREGRALFSNTSVGVDLMSVHS